MVGRLPGVARCRSLAAGLAALALPACTATLPVRTIPKGETRWIASVGGPLLPHHAPTGMIPYATVGRMWGRSDAVTLSANVHALAAAFGVAGVDIGAARRLRAGDGWRPELTGQAQVYAFGGSAGTRIWPNLTANASWKLGDRTLVYAGTAATGRLTGGGQAILLSPLAGIQRDVTRRLTVQVEGKWMASNADMTSGLFEGENSVGGNGGLALQFGFQRKR